MMVVVAAVSLPANPGCPDHHAVHVCHRTGRSRRQRHGIGNGFTDIRHYELA